MTYEQFRLKSHYVQQTLARKHGVFLLTKSENGVTAFLFQLEGFYVELFYDDEKIRLLHSSSFDNTDLLEDYLKEIDLSEVQNMLNCN